MLRGVDSLARARYPPRSAEVVELVDALASGASGRKLVGVRVPPSALQTKNGDGQCPSPFFVPFVQLSGAAQA